MQSMSRRIKTRGTEKEKKAVTSEEKFVMKVKADELAKDGAEVDGGAMAAAMALTIKPLRKDICASIDYAAGLNGVRSWVESSSAVRCGKRSKTEKTRGTVMVSSESAKNPNKTLENEATATMMSMVYSVSWRRMGECQFVAEECSG